MARRSPLDTRERANAQALLDCIETEMAGAQWFTRDDLLGLTAFAHVATITRYQYTCAAVAYLLRRRALVQAGGKSHRSRTELALPGRGGAYETPLDLANRHMSALRRLATSGASAHPDGTVSVAGMLARWKPEDALAENVRRSVIRAALRRMAMGGVLERAEKPGSYRPVPD